ncbi:hypothetical protein F442_22519, partial [Phytophthora nicotianae P10297]
KFDNVDSVKSLFNILENRSYWFPPGNNFESPKLQTAA